jgi:hypothetical protein
MQKQSLRIETTGLMIGLGLIMLNLILISGCAATWKQSAPPAPPSNFQTLAEVNLADRAHAEETLAQFTLEESAVVGIHYSAQNIDTAYFKLNLEAETGTSYQILESEDYRTDANGGGSWQKSLAPGIYRLVLSAPQSPGTLSVGWGILDDPSGGEGS